MEGEQALFSVAPSAVDRALRIADLKAPVPSAPSHGTARAECGNVWQVRRGPYRGVTRWHNVVNACCDSDNYSGLEGFIYDRGMAPQAGSRFCFCFLQGCNQPEPHCDDLKADRMIQQRLPRSSNTARRIATAMVDGARAEAAQVSSSCHMACQRSACCMHFEIG